jgi:hypothetical protein
MKGGVAELLPTPQPRDLKERAFPDSAQGLEQQRERRRRFVLPRKQCDGAARKPSHALQQDACRGACGG